MAVSHVCVPIYQAPPIGGGWLPASYEEFSYFLNVLKTFRSRARQRLIRNKREDVNSINDVRREKHSKEICSKYYLLKITC